jgi:hypothetical protein
MTLFLYPLYRQLPRRWKGIVIVGVIIVVIFEAASSVIVDCLYYLPDVDGAFLWYAGAWLVAAGGGILSGYAAATSGLFDIRWQNEQNEQNEQSEQSEQSEQNEQNEQNEQSEQNEQNEQSEQNAGSRDAVSPWRRMALATAFVLVVAVISSTILAALQYPALPSVKVQSQTKEYDEKTFALLSHSNQYWYVLNKEPKRDKEPESAVLNAIPDDKVEQVTFVEDKRGPLGVCPYADTDVLGELWERIKGFLLG